MESVNNAFTIFLSLLVEAFPFLLLGVLLSSALLLFVNERKLLALLPKNPLLGALAGSSIGFLFPVCECGNVPVARRLLMQGVPSSVAIGFLLAAPTVNPIVVWSTWTAFRDRPEMVLWRVGLSLAIATIVGAIFSVQTDLRPFMQPGVARSMPRSPVEEKGAEEKPALLRSGTYFAGASGQRLEAALMAMQAGVPNTMPLPAAPRRPNKLRLFLDNTLQELRELGAVLILGSAIVAVIQVAVPREVITDLARGTILPILVMLAMAVIVSVCSTVDAFFALSFSSIFPSSALLAFLVFGPMVDLKGIGLMLSVFRPRAVFYLFAIAGQLTLLFTLLLSFLL